MLWCLNIATTRGLLPWYTFPSVCGCPSFILFLAACCLVGSRRRRVLKLLFGSALSNPDADHWCFLPGTLSFSKSGCSFQSLTFAWSFQEKITNEFNVTKHYIWPGLPYLASVRISCRFFSCSWKLCMLHGVSLLASVSRPLLVAHSKHMTAPSYKGRIHFMMIDLLPAKPETLPLKMRSVSVHTQP